MVSCLSSLVSKFRSEFFLAPEDIYRRKLYTTTLTLHRSVLRSSESVILLRIFLSPRAYMGRAQNFSKSQNLYRDRAWNLSKSQGLYNYREKGMYDESHLASLSASLF